MGLGALEGVGIGLGASKWVGLGIVDLDGGGGGGGGTYSRGMDGYGEGDMYPGLGIIVNCWGNKVE